MRGLLDEREDALRPVALVRAAGLGEPAAHLRVELEVEPFASSVRAFFSYESAAATESPKNVTRGRAVLPPEAAEAATTAARATASRAATRRISGHYLPAA